MSEEEKDAAAVRFPPPFVYLIAMAVGVVLQSFVVAIPFALPTALRTGVAVVAVLAGAALIASAVGLFRSIGQDLAPWTPTPEIVTDGVYRFTRNPMYVGLTLLQLGIGVALANGWIVALIPVVLVLIYAIAIRHEEAYLERKFGEGYLVYKRSVRRWL